VDNCRGVLQETDLAFEIIVVDDGSADATAALAESASARVIRHPANAGYGRSLKDGVLAARFETIAIVDADGTYPVEELPRLLKKFAAGFDMVVGARTGKHYRQSVLKSLLRGLLQALVEWSCNKAIPDINSGLRVFGRKDAIFFFRHLCDTFSFTTSITLAYMMTGHYVAYVPISYGVRIGSSHINLAKDSLYTLGYILRQILYFDPLKIFMLFAFCWMTGGVGGFLFSLITGLSIGYQFGILSIFGVFLMLGFGLLAEQIRQLVVRREDSGE
jgi:glycosyltransferase involved in cell wall biosynthesis